MRHTTFLPYGIEQFLNSLLLFLIRVQIEFEMLSQEEWLHFYVVIFFTKFDKWHLQKCSKHPDKLRSNECKNTKSCDCNFDHVTYHFFHSLRSHHKNIVRTGIRREQKPYWLLGYVLANECAQKRKKIYETALDLRKHLCFFSLLLVVVAALACVVHGIAMSICWGVDRLLSVVF